MMFWVAKFLGSSISLGLPWTTYGLSPKLGPALLLTCCFPCCLSPLPWQLLSTELSTKRYTTPPPAAFPRHSLCQVSVDVLEFFKPEVTTVTEAAFYHCSLPAFFLGDFAPETQRLTTAAFHDPLMPLKVSHGKFFNIAYQVLRPTRNAALFHQPLAHSFFMLTLDPEQIIHRSFHLVLSVSY